MWMSINNIPFHMLENSVDNIEGTNKKSHPVQWIYEGINDISKKGMSTKYGWTNWRCLNKESRYEYTREIVGADRGYDTVNMYQYMGDLEQTKDTIPWIYEWVLIKDDIDCKNLDVSYKGDCGHRGWGGRGRRAVLVDAFDEVYISCCSQQPL